MTQPYTHARHAQRCRQMADSGAVLDRQWVQAQKHGVIYCGRIIAAYTVPNGTDCWTLETVTPEIARFTVPVKKVRLCGDSVCVCAEQAVGVGRGEPATHEPPAVGLEVGSKVVRC